MKNFFYAVGIIFLSSSSIAHDDVQNKAVKARMQAMKEIASNIKALKGIAKGSVSFDNSKAGAIVLQIADIAKKVPSLFEQEETDPKSKAKPEIWFDYEDFSLRAKRLEKVAFNLSKTISNPQDLKMAMRQLGGACKSCHELYKN
mgnify:CR=1 FL=1